jgi:hypothetical protein
VPACQVAYEVARAALLHAQLDAGITAAEAGQRVGEQAREQGRRRAQAYAAAAQAGEVLHLAPGRLHVGEDAPREREQRLTGGRQRDVAAGTAEQRRAELGLQRPDLLGQRRLRHPERLSRTCEVPHLRDRDEVRELL